MQILFEIEIDKNVHKIKASCDEIGENLLNNVSRYFDLEEEIVFNLLINPIPDQMNQRWILKNKIISEQIPNRMLSRPLRAQPHLSYIPNQLNYMKLSNNAINFIYHLTTMAVVNGEMILNFDEFCDIIGFAICAEDNLFNKSNLISYVPKRLFHDSNLTTFEWENKLTEISQKMLDSNKSSEDYKREFINRIQELQNTPKFEILINDSVIKSILIDKNGFSVFQKSMNPQWEKIDENIVVDYSYEEGEISIKTLDLKEVTLSLKNYENGVLIQNLLLELRKLNFFKNLSQISQLNESHDQKNVSVESAKIESSSDWSTSYSDMNETDLNIHFDGNVTKIKINQDDKVIEILKSLSAKLKFEEYWFYGLQSFDSEEGINPLYSEQNLSSQSKIQLMDYKIVFYCLPHNFSTYCVNQQNKIRLYHRIVNLIMEEKLQPTENQLLKLAAISKIIEPYSSKGDDLESKCKDSPKYWIFNRHHRKLLSLNYEKFYFVNYFLKISREISNYGLFKFLKIDLNKINGINMECDPEKMKFSQKNEHIFIYYKDCYNFNLSNEIITFSFNDTINTISKKGNLIFYIFDVISNYIRAYENSINITRQIEPFSNIETFIEFSDDENKQEVKSSTNESKNNKKTTKYNKKMIMCELEHEGNLTNLELSGDLNGYDLVIKACNLVGYKFPLCINIEYLCPKKNIYVFLLKYKMLRKQSIALNKTRIRIYLKYYILLYNTEIIRPSQINLFYETLKENFANKIKITDINKISQIIGLALYIDIGSYVEGMKYQYEYHKYIPSGMNNDWEKIFHELHEKTSILMEDKTKLEAIHNYIEIILSIENFQKKQIFIQKYNSQQFDAITFEERNIKITNSQETIIIPYIDLQNSSYKNKFIILFLKNKRKFKVKFNNINDRRRAYDYYLHYTILFKKIEKLKEALTDVTTSTPVLDKLESDLPSDKNQKITENNIQDEIEIEESDNEKITDSQNIEKEPSTSLSVEFHEMDELIPEVKVSSNRDESSTELEIVDQTNCEPSEVKEYSNGESESISIDLEDLISDLMSKYKTIKENIETFKSKFLGVMRYVDKETEKEIFLLFRRNLHIFNKIDAIHTVYRKYSNSDIFTCPESVLLHTDGCRITSENLETLLKLIANIQTSQSNSSTIRVKSDIYSECQVNMNALNLSKKQSIRVIFGKEYESPSYDSNKYNQKYVTLKNDESFNRSLISENNPDEYISTAFYEFKA